MVKGFDKFKQFFAPHSDSFTEQAAAKLRRHGLLAAGCNIYAQIFAKDIGNKSWHMKR